MKRHHPPLTPKLQPDISDALAPRRRTTIATSALGCRGWFAFPGGHGGLAGRCHVLLLVALLVISACGTRDREFVVGSQEYRDADVNQTIPREPFALEVRGIVVEADLWSWPTAEGGKDTRDHTERAEWPAVSVGSQTIWTSLPSAPAFASLSLFDSKPTPGDEPILDGMCDSVDSGCSIESNSSGVLLSLDLTSHLPSYVVVSATFDDGLADAPASISWLFLATP